MFSSWRTLPGKSNWRQPRERGIGDALAFDAELARALLQEEAGQRRDVFLALAQRRQAQADDVEAMEQVFAERAGLDPLLQVLVRGGDDAHVAAHRVVAADAIELAVGEHAQQARLQVERHVADLVEEERAAVGLLEAAAARGLRAGEGAALVAEQLGLEQVLRDRRGVDRDERAAGARAVLVQGVGDQLLAGARFAGDQHRDDALAQPADGAEHVLHRRRLAEDLRHLRGRRLGLAPRAGSPRRRGGSARPPWARRRAWAGSRRRRPGRR